jgi:hypothetical protein
VAALEKETKRGRVRKLGAWQYLMLVVSGVTLSTRYIGLIGLICSIGSV